MLKMDYSNFIFILMVEHWGYYFYRIYLNFLIYSEIPWINNPYVSVFIGAMLLYVASIFLTDHVINFIKWMEERLLKAPIVDLLFGTLGLIVGLSVAFFLGSVWLSNIANSGNYVRLCRYYCPLFLDI